MSLHNHFTNVATGDHPTTIGPAVDSPVLGVETPGPAAPTAATIPTQDHHRTAGGAAAALGTAVTAFRSSKPGRLKRRRRRRISAREAARREVQRALWEIQRVMWKVTNIKRLAGCHRWRNGSGVLLTKRGRRSGFAGLQDSHSVWASPVAAAAIAKRRIQETTRAVENFLAGGEGRSVMVLTLTMPHTQGMDLRVLMDVLADAHAALFRRVWRTRYGVEHVRKAVEVTHGVNGFHPHEHVLLFMERALSSVELEALKAEVHKAWSALVVSHGAKHGLELAAPSWEHGVVVDQADDLDAARALATYAAKANQETWTQAAEVAGGVFKRAKGSSRTPWQVLEDLGKGREGNPDYARDLAVWLEYEKATDGRRQSSWSAGAVEALGVEVVKDEDIDSGEEVVDGEDDEGEEERALVEIHPEDWDNGFCLEVEKQLELKAEVAAAVDSAEALVVAVDLLTGWGVRFTVVDVAVPPVGGYRAWRTDVDAARAVL